MNTRDIRELLRGHIDPRLGKVLISQQEDIASLKQMVIKLAGLIDSILNNQITQATVVEQMRALRPLAEKQRQVAVDVGGDPSLTGQYDG
jgi:hypothetical protein